MDKNLETVQAIIEPEIEQYIENQEDIETIVNLMKEKKKA